MSMGSIMEYRQLGQSGLRVSVLSLGTMTFGGETFFNKVGATDVKGARRQVGPLPGGRCQPFRYGQHLLPRTIRRDSWSSFGRPS